MPYTTTDHHIRWMIRRDLKDVISIHNSVCVHKTNEEKLIKILRKRNVIALVIENENGAIVGFCIYELSKPHITILSLVISPDYEGRGYGSTLLNKLKGKLSTERRSRLLFPVRESYLLSLPWLKRQGFRAVQMIPYFENGELAVVMRYQLLPNGEIA